MPPVSADSGAGSRLLPPDAPPARVTPTEPTSGLVRAVCAPIHLYRALSAHRLPHCRYWPTCSAYALESVEVHGATRGLWMAVRRLARCHPWGGFGADPVPPASASGAISEPVPA